MKINSQDVFLNNLYSMIKHVNQLAKKNPKQSLNQHDCPFILDPKKFNYHDLDFVPGYELINNYETIINNIKQDPQNLTIKQVRIAFNFIYKTFGENLNHMYFNDICTDTYPRDIVMFNPLSKKEILDRLVAYVFNYQNKLVNNKTNSKLYIQNIISENRLNDENKNMKKLKKDTKLNIVLDINNKKKICKTITSIDDCNRTNQWYDSYPWYLDI